MQTLTKPQEHALRRLSLDPRLSFIADIADEVPEAEWFVVGGAVRDALLGRGAAPEDIDLVVRNAPLDRVTAALGRLGGVDLVGRSFGVLKFSRKAGERPIDIALPRTELARGTGAYRDFDVYSDEELPIEDDLARRDFTVNAMAWRLGSGGLVDPHGGFADLSRKRIRAVGSPERRFTEDRSRVLRGMRFACQLGFDIEAATWDAISAHAARINELKSAGSDGDRTERVVPYETVAKELVKALAADAVRAVDLFERSGALFAAVPEFAEMARTPQSPENHSEGDVWTHTKLAVEALCGSGFTEWFPGERPDALTVLATLFHDIGKPSTRGEDGGRITFYGHDAVGADIAARTADRLRLSSVDGHDVDRDVLSWLVRMHLFPNMVDLDEVRRTTLHRHLLSDPSRGRRLLHLAYADATASIPEGRSPDLGNLRRLIAMLPGIEDAAARPAALITGDDVMAIAGIGAGPEVGRILADIQEAQLRGEITTERQAQDLIRARTGT